MPRFRSQTLLRGAIVWAAIAAGVAAPGVARAHAPSAGGGSFGAIASAWTPDPLAILTVVALAGLYGWGLVRLRRTAPRFRFSAWSPVAWGLGVLLLLLALISPIDTYGDDLFTVHMGQHMVMMFAVAPLLLLGAPVTLALRSASPRVRRAWLVPLVRSRVVAGITHPAVALAIFLGTVWAWHIPAAYDAAVEHEAVHMLQHGSFLGGALLFWWLIIGVDASARRPRHLWRLLPILGAMLGKAPLAMLLSVATSPWYDRYVAAAAQRDWWTDSLDDQKTGAMVMWLPGAVLFSLAALFTFYAWTEQQEFRSRRDDMLRSVRRRGGALGGRGRGAAEGAAGMLGRR